MKTLRKVRNTIDTWRAQRQLDKSPAKGTRIQVFDRDDPPEVESDLGPFTDVDGRVYQPGYRETIEKDGMLIEVHLHGVRPNGELVATLHQVPR